SGLGRYRYARWRRAQKGPALGVVHSASRRAAWRRILAAAKRTDRLSAAIEDLDGDAVRWRVFQVVRNDDARPRILTDSRRRDAAATAAAAEPHGLARLEEMRDGRGHLRRDLPECREIVENPERPPLRRRHEIR